MIRLVTRGRLTQSYAKGLLAASEDREPAVRKLIEAARRGGGCARWNQVPGFAVTCLQPACRLC
jgi:hypothetical protein